MKVNIVREGFLERQKLTLLISKSNEIDESKVLELMQETLRLCIKFNIRFDVYQTEKDYILMLESKDTELITLIWKLEHYFPNINFNY